MQYIADLHIHSKYSRATSRRMELEHLDKWAKIKGIQILGTGDFTHPAWFKELKEKLQPIENGIYQLKTPAPKGRPLRSRESEARGSPNEVGRQSSKRLSTQFILTTEISCIYSKGGKARRIHLVVFAPDLETVEKINQRLGAKYNLRSDGRPILGLDAKELTKILLDISQNIFVVPAHVWTPWYALFGSKSGFDSIEQCFEEMTPYIYALETGLSSNPPMNWQWSYLDKYTLISNSDAHSPENLGREANVFEFGKEPNYNDIIQAMKTRKNFLYTIEFFPEEGKYHFDGHRLCGIRFDPSQTKKEKGICPKCRRPLTVGVMYRVEELADRSKPKKPNEAPDYKSAIPLKEIIAEIIGHGKNTKGVAQIYNDLIKKGKNEFNILLNLSQEELNNLGLPKVTEAILKMRRGEVIKEPGYDGVYGKIKLFQSSLKKRINQDKKMRIKDSRQKSLF